MEKENKLQQLTEKLYNEGLSKGRQQADTIVTEAKAEADRIIKQAQEQAQTIINKAKQEAQEISVNTENEIRLASSQAISSLRQQIERMILTQVTTPVVDEAWKDGTFIKSLILDAVKAFDPKAEEPIRVTVPEKMMGEVEQNIKAQFAAGVEVVTDSRVKVPFRIAPADGSYYVSFTDADFDKLIRNYLRPKVAELLFAENKK